MDWENLQKKLTTAARNNPPSDSVPYAFEKRIMALITSKPVPDALAVWARALWRGAASCVAVMIVLGAISFFTPAKTISNGDLSQDFENTLLAAVDQQDEAQ